MELVLALIAGLTLGCIHAFDVDHLSAVAVFASKHPSPQKAFRFGLMWGLGHTAALVVLGLFVTAFRFVIPPVVESLAELLVGILLVAIGGWVLRDVFKRKHIHIHQHTHDGVEHVHFHSHANSIEHRHRHSLFFVGATHGLAGTASVMVLIPLAASQSLLTSAAFLLLFGVGTIVAMSFFAFLFGIMSTKIAQTTQLSKLQSIAGAVSIIIGFFWIGNVLFS